jgi:hypothetical protein
MAHRLRLLGLAGAKRGRSVPVTRLFGAAEAKEEVTGLGR